MGGWLRSVRRGLRGWLGEWLSTQGKFVLQIIMFKINKRRVGTFLCPRGHQPAWADDRAVCPPYDYLENKFTLA